MKGNKSQHSRSILGVTGDVVPNSLGPNGEVQNNVISKSLDFYWHGKFWVSHCNFARQGVLTPWNGCLSKSQLSVFTLTSVTSAVFVGISKKEVYFFVASP